MRRNPNSIIFLLIGMLLVSNMLNGRFDNISSYIYEMVTMLPAIILGLSFHEFAHAFVSDKLGDPTPKYQGRVTLNPAAHIDPFGLIALVFAGFGWGKPVQIDPRYYKHRRRDEFLVGIAGVVTNLILAIVFDWIFRVCFRTEFLAMFFTKFPFTEVLVDVIANVVLINLVLMVFNLLPIPPLDGFGLITQIFKLDRHSWYYTFRNNGFFILMIFILLDVPSRIISPIVLRLYMLLIFA